MAEERAAMNVVEAYSLFDTVQIGAKVEGDEGYASFPALAAEEEIPFFTKRTRSKVGLAYTNKDSTDALPFAFHVYSLGVHWLGFPERVPLPTEPTADQISEFEAGYLFEKIIPLHTGVTLKVREDERLAHTAELAPPGTGVLGTNAGAYNNAPVHAATQGWPDLANRWRFPEPIRVPRNTIVTVNLKFSKYAKSLLLAMLGPGTIDLSLGPNQPIKLPRNALIRVSLIGKREVQQRGELHF
jgi:hypothetical protein